jgi:hypothetical protein
MVLARRCGIADHIEPGGADDDILEFAASLEEMIKMRMMEIREPLFRRGD